MDLLSSWHKAKRIPTGRFWFHLYLRRFVPYTGSVRPRILDLERGRSRVQMLDQRRVRNHLQSIHAIALANLGEFATGLALLTALPPNTRAILIEIRVRYTRKARGTITAEATWDASTIDTESADQQTIVRGQLLGGDGLAVATIEAHWQVGTR